MKIVRCLFLLGCSTLMFAATDLTGVTCFSAKQYPSLVPINVIRVPLAMAVGLDEAMWSTLGWDPDRLASYKVLKANGDVVPIIRLEFPHTPKSGVDRSLVYLVVPPDVSTDDKLTITLLSTNSREIAKTAQPVPVESTTQYGISFNPQAVPNEELASGKKRDVGQFTSKLNLPSLTPRWSFARTYFTTDNLISTDERDKKSKVDGKVGIERSLSGRWYLPVQLETEAQGDQVGNNLSYLAGGGFQTILPWAFSKSILYNSVLQIPTSPTFAFDFKYERRINQDADSLKRFHNKNGLRLHEQTTWKAWRLLPGVIGQDTAWIELAGQGWYLPLDEDGTGKGRPRLEGAGEVSLYLSLAKLSTVPGINFLTNSDPLHTAVRIGYSGGANEANGFKHSRQPIFGLVVVK